MTVTGILNTVNYNNIRIISGNEESERLFKTAMNEALSEMPEADILAEYPTLCGCEDDKSEAAEEAAAEEDSSEIEDDTEEITSCLECEERFDCKHYQATGEDILAKNGLTVRKGKGGNFGRTDDDIMQELLVKPFDMSVVYDLSNIYFDVDEKKRRV